MKTDSFRRICAVLLLCALLCGAGCGSSSGPNKAADSTVNGDITESAAETTAELSLAEQRALVKDDLPDADFSGETFTITINSFCESGFFSEELSGDVLGDAIYERNANVAERFNIDLNMYSGDYNSIGTTVKNSVLSGEDAYQLSAQHCANAGSWVTSNILMNWNDLGHVDFTRPWWSESNIDLLTVNDVCLLAVGDFALSTVGRTYSVYFDKIEAEAYQLPDLYEIVYEGEWTIDRIFDYTRDVYRDLNSNGIVDTFEDFFGYSTSTGTNIAVYQQSFGIELIRDGEIVISVEKMQSALEKLNGFFHTAPGAAYDTSYKNAAGNPHYIGAEKMQNSTTLFANALLETGINYLRDVEHDYGILPYPKWDEAQEDYRTTVDLGFTALAVPKTVADTDRTGIIAEALCAETYRIVLPVYYEYALKQKGARDDDSIAMIDFIVNTRFFDFGVIFDNWKGFAFELERMVKENNSDYASRYASKINTITDWYDSVIEVFNGYDG